MLPQWRALQQESQGAPVSEDSIPSSDSPRNGPRRVDQSRTPRKDHPLNLFLPWLPKLRAPQVLMRVWMWPRFPDPAPHLSRPMHQVGRVNVGIYFRDAKRLACVQWKRNFSCWKCLSVSTALSTYSTRSCRSVIERQQCSMPWSHSEFLPKVTLRVEWRGRVYKSALSLLVPKICFSPPLHHNESILRELTSTEPTANNFRRSLTNSKWFQAL